MRVVAALASALVILEFSLSAIAMIGVARVGVERFSALTRTSPAPPVVVGIGVADLLGVAGAIAGFWTAWPAVAAGGYFTLLTAFVLLRQVTHGDRGTALLPYALFLTASALLLGTRLAGLG